MLIVGEKISYPAVHSLALIEISSPMNIHGKKGSNGTSCKKIAGAKKNPAATNGACLGTDGMDLSKVMDDPNLIICLKESVNERVIE